MSQPAHHEARTDAWPMAVRLVPFALVILATLPDAMSYPGLKKVVSLRFGQGDASTQLFTIESSVDISLALCASTQCI